MTDNMRADCRELFSFENYWSHSGQLYMGGKFLTLCLYFLSCQKVYVASLTPMFTPHLPERFVKTESRLFLIILEQLFLIKFILNLTFQNHPILYFHAYIFGYTSESEVLTSWKHSHITTKEGPFLIWHPMFKNTDGMMYPKISIPCCEYGCLN